MSVLHISGEVGEPTWRQNQSEPFENVIEISELLQPSTIETSSHPGNRRVGGATVHFTVEHPADNSKLESDTAFIIAHGICGIEDAYTDLRGALAESGYRAVTYKPPRSVGIRKGMHPAHLWHPEKLLGQAVYGAMRGAQEQFGYKKFVVVSHSLGGLTAKSLIDHHDEDLPELVDGLVLMDTVALHPHSWKETGVDFVKMVGAQIGSYVKMRAAQDSPVTLVQAAAAEAHYLFREPTRVWREGIKAKNTSHIEMGKTLERARDLGISVGYLGMERSVVFSDEKVLWYSGHHFDEHRSGDWDHLGPMVDPEGTTSAVIDITNGFVARQKQQLRIVANAG
jgi:pimeloyl-ACP methyl ester carboxylesterase